MIRILGGILIFESDWTRALGESLLDSLVRGQGEDRLNLGCVAAHGYFSFVEQDSRNELYASGKSATTFLFKPNTQLQFSGTFPMIDMQSYSE